MGSFVGSLVRLVGMSRIQQLSGFQNHLDDMFVAVLFRRPPRVSGQYEDVHRNEIPMNLCFHFCNATALPDLVCQPNSIAIFRASVVVLSQTLESAATSPSSISYETVMELRETQAPALPSPADLPQLWKLRQEACESRGFQLQPQQRFLRRVLSPDTPVRNVLVVHGTGVGKTCSAIQIAEE